LIGVEEKSTTKLVILMAPIPPGLIPLKYIRIQATASISKAVIRIYYTDGELSAAGIYPETLRIYHSV